MCPKRTEGAYGTCPSPKKNPCKICLAPVNPKNGIQCQGACRTWVHFECLNYTPGKIQDIKKGLIKITCPCPDCKTTHLTKEFRTDAPVSCSNLLCPANRPPKCENEQCPLNKTTNTSFLGPCDKKACKAHGPGSPDFEIMPPIHPVAGSHPASAGSQPRQQCNQQQNTPFQYECPRQKCDPMPCPSGCQPLGAEIIQAIGGGGGGGGCGAGADSGGGGGMPPGGGGRMPPSGGGGGATSCGDTQNQLSHSGSTVEVMQEMCATVGKLTRQINDLMCKMQDTMKSSSPGYGISPTNSSGCLPPVCKKGPKSHCPKPCYCPNNPRR